MQVHVVYIPDMNPSVSLLSWMGQPVDSVTSHKRAVHYVFYDHSVWYCHPVTCSPGLVWSR